MLVNGMVGLILIGDLNMQHKVSLAFAILLSVHILFPAIGVCEGSRIATTKVGFILPLTGEFSFFGDQARKGAEIAIQELALEGIKLEAFFEDDACLPKNAVTAFQTLTSVKKVDWIIGPGCTGAILAVSPLAKRKPLPVLALLDANREVEASGGVAVLGFSSEREPELVAEEMFKRGIDKVAMICEADAWAKLVCDTFKADWLRRDKELVLNEVQNVSDRDYRPVIQLAVKTDPDAIYFVPAYNGGIFLKQARQLGVKIPIYGPDTFGVQEALDVAGDAAEGIVYASVDVIPETPSQMKFLKDFNSKFGEDPSSFYYAALGYDATKIVLQAHTSGLPWREALSNLNYSDAVLPNVKFDRNLMACIEPSLMTVFSGKFVKK